MIRDPILSRPSSLQILQEASRHVQSTLPDLVISLNSFMGNSNDNYLLKAISILSGWLDDRNSWHLKSTRHRRREILKRLHVLCDEDGADVVFDMKATSLHVAVVLNRVGKVKDLLKSLKPDSDEKSQVVNLEWKESGWTALHLAYQAKRCKDAAEIEDILIKAGADLEARDKHGLRPRECRDVGEDVDFQEDVDPGEVRKGDLLDRHLTMMIRESANS